MADVVVSLKLMPTSPEVDYEKIIEVSRKHIAEFAENDEVKVEEEPIAFGLKALKLIFVMDEEKGSTDDLEENLGAVDGVQSVEVTDVRRAIG